jgi:gag-polypeptide of LTR copia-type
MSQFDNTKLTTITLNGNRNYIPWSRSVTIGLGGKGKLNFITGTKTKPIPAKPNEATAEENVNIAEWETTDQMIMSWLVTTMEPQILNVLMYSKTSKEIWDKAKRRYDQQKNYAHIFSLKQELALIKQSKQTNNELVTEIISKWEELNMYLPPTSDPLETQKRVEQDFIFTYLGALDSSYDTIRSQILASTEIPSFDDIVARIDQEESRRALMNPRLSKNQESSAFQVHNSKPSFRDTAIGKGAPSTERCDHYKKAGHNRDECWFLYPHLRPIREKGNWSGARKEKKRFGGLSKTDEIKEAQPSNPNPPAGSSVAQTVQLNQLLTQLNNLLQQQTSSFVHFKDFFNSPNIYSSSQIANICQTKHFSFKD